MKTSRFNHRTRLLGWLLTLAMLFSLAPVSAFAAETFCGVGDVYVTSDNCDQITGDKINGTIIYDVQGQTLNFTGPVKLGSENDPCENMLFQYRGKKVTLFANDTVEGWTNSGGFFMPVSISGGTYILHGGGTTGSAGIAGTTDVTATVIEQDTVVELDGFSSGLSSGGVDIYGTVIINDAAYGITDGGKVLEPGGKLEVHADTLINGKLTYKGGELLLASTTVENLKDLNISTMEDFWYRTGKDDDFIKTTAAEFTKPETAYLELTDIDPATGKIYDLWVSGVQVMDANAADILEDGTASYAPDTNTLTLSNAVLQGAEANDYAGIKTELPNLIITGSAEFQNGNGIHSDSGNVSLQGADLKFDVTNGLADGITLSAGILTVDASALNFVGDAEDSAIYAIRADGGVWSTASSIRITSTSSEDGEQLPFFDYGIHTSALTVESGELDLQGDTCAIYADESMTVSGVYTEITARGPSGGTAIDTDQLNLNDGLAELEGKVNESDRVVIGLPCSHDYSEDWNYDGESHWHRCTLCGAKADEELHSYDENGVCTVCGYDSMGGDTPIGPGGDSGAGAAIAVIGGAAAVVGGGVLLARHYIRSNLPEGAAVPATRRELAVALWQMAGRPEPVSQTVYTDIPETDAETAKAVRWAAENGLLKADSDESFGADAKVSRLDVLGAMIRTEFAGK